MKHKLRTIVRNSGKEGLKLEKLNVWYGFLLFLTPSFKNSTSLLKILSALKNLTEPTIIFSHFMVINIVVSTLKNDPRVVSFYPDNCSITELGSNKGKLNLISTGSELQTRIN